MMVQIDIGRLRALMAEKKFKAQTLSRAAGLGDTFVYDLLNGKKTTMRLSSVQRLAAALGCTPEYLTNTSDAPSSAGGPAGAIRIADTIRTGIWREAGAEPTEVPDLYVYPAPDFPAEAQRAYLVEDDHAAGFGILPGTIVTAIIEGDRELKQGDLAIIRRTIGGQVFELSIREYAGDRLIARSRAGDQSIPSADAEIVGRIHSLTRVFG